MGVPTWTCHPGHRFHGFSSARCRRSISESESLHPSLGLSWICLRGSPQKNIIIYIYIFTIDSPNGGFSVGKIKNHLKQTHVMSSSWFTSRNWAPGPLSGTSKWAMAQVPRLERFQTLPGRSQLVLSGHNSEVGFWRVHKSRWAMVIK